MTSVPPPENSQPVPPVTPPPSYQQPAYQQPAYQQPVYQQPGAYPAAQAYVQPYAGVPAGYPGYGAGYAAAPKSKVLGVVAMYGAIVVLVLSVIASIVVGNSVGPIADRSSTGFSYSTSTMTAEQAAAFGGTALLILAQLAGGTVIGLWALIQGIIAAATKRGRAYGVIAIVVAAAAPIISFIVYIAAIAASTPA
ncbi:hypothetical protein [Leifsonia poae]|uniref:hypothetical protein n=1 Tax=Leifsonia poae TaxID=110933 RepID=UPI003D669F3E